MATVQLIKSLGAIVLCAVLLRMVWRGRWTAWNHPLCAKCGFNLHGLPGTSLRCPECGEELAKVKTTGVWRWRWKALGASMILIVLTLAVILHEVEWPAVLTQLPTSLLIRMDPMLAGDPRTAEVRRIVNNELSKRIGRNNLSHAQLKSLAEASLKMLSLPGAYSPVYYDRVQYAHDQGDVTPQMWAQLAKLSFWVSVQPRKVIARGEPIAMQVFCPARAAFDLSVVPTVTIDGQPIDAVAQPAKIMLTHGGDLQPFFIEIPPKMLATLAPGSHTLTINLDMQALDRGTTVGLASKKLTSTSTITLLPPGTPSVKLAMFASLDPKILSRWTPWKLFQVQGVDRDTGQPIFVAFDARTGDNAPVLYTNGNSGITAIYRVMARSNGKEILLGHLLGFRWMPAKAPAKITGPTVDVILRPDPQMAARFPYISTILSDELVYQDVPVP